MAYSGPTPPLDQSNPQETTPSVGLGGLVSGALSLFSGNLPGAAIGLMRGLPGDPSVPSRDMSPDGGGEFSTQDSSFLSRETALRQQLGREPTQVELDSMMGQSLVPQTSPQGVTQFPGFSPVMKDDRGGFTPGQIKLFDPGEFKAPDLTSGLESPQSITDRLTGLIPQATSERTKQLFGAADMLEKQAASFDFEPLTAARRQVFKQQRERLNLAKTAALGDITESFRRNKVLGSSLAADRIAGAAAEFALAENELAGREATEVATSKLQELEIKTSLLERASQQRITAATAAIDDAFNVANIGVQAQQIHGQIKASLTALEQENLNVQLQLAAREAQGVRDFLLGQQELDVRRQGIEAGRDVGMAEIGQNRDEFIGGGIGGLLQPIIGPTLGRLGESLVGSLF